MCPACCSVDLLRYSNTPLRIKQCVSYRRCHPCPHAQVHSGNLHPCIFEYIYLARPDSVLNDISVYNFQLELGSNLARRIKESGWHLDLVCPVPDGSRPSAIQVSICLVGRVRKSLKPLQNGRGWHINSQ